MSREELRVDGGHPVEDKRCMLLSGLGEGAGGVGHGEEDAKKKNNLSAYYRPLLTDTKRYVIKLKRRNENNRNHNIKITKEQVNC